MTTFDLWWVAEVGHPPANDQERYAFEMARKAWDASSDRAETLEWDALKALLQDVSRPWGNDQCIVCRNFIVDCDRTARCIGAGIRKFLEQTPRPTKCEECGEVVTESMLVVDRRLCVPCGCHACDVCGAVDSETINGMDRCLEHTPEADR